jgi:hypothetical protein
VISYADGRKNHTGLHALHRSHYGDRILSNVAVLR